MIYHHFIMSSNSSAEKAASLAAKLSWRVVCSVLEVGMIVELESETWHSAKLVYTLFI